MPDGIADIVVLAPVPAIAPGFIIQLPAGRPLSITLPVDTAHVGCVIVPTIGIAGAPGAVLIVTTEEGEDTQPEALVTVKLYAPLARPAIVVLVPAPLIAPGLIVQLPAGKLFKTTLPVARAHVGWVIAPATGTPGTALTVNV